MSVTSNFWQTHRPATPINKRRAYITLPAFSSAFTWRGKSTIVAEYQYSATNNFTLFQVPEKPTDANFTLCIKYRIGSTVYRYKLWSTDNDNCYFPAYTGEVIKKYFTLEVWSTEDNTPVVLADDTVFKLSILKVRETLSESDTYSNADASTIIEQGALVNTNVMTPVTEPFQDTLTNYFKSEGLEVINGLVYSWVGQYETLSPSAAEPSADSINGLSTAICTAPNALDTVAVTPDVEGEHIFALIKFRAWESAEVIFDFTGSFSLYYSTDISNGVRIGSGPDGQEVVMDRWYIVEALISGGNAIMRLTPLDGATDPVEDNFGASSTGSITNYKLGSETGEPSSEFAEILFYGSEVTGADYEQTINYLRYKYAPILLPLTYTTTQHGQSNS